MYCCIPTPTTDSNTRTGMIWVTLNMPSAAEECREPSRNFTLSGEWSPWNWQSSETSCYCNFVALRCTFCWTVLSFTSGDQHSKLQSTSYKLPESQQHQAFWSSCLPFSTLPWVYLQTLNTEQICSDWNSQTLSSATSFYYERLAKWGMITLETAAWGLWLKSLMSSMVLTLKHKDRDFRQWGIHGQTCSDSL